MDLRRRGVTWTAAERSPPGMDSLPGDLVADVLALLPPRSLAACRCVCKAWRAAVDAGRLLRADLLPLQVGGVFTNMLHELVPAQFLRRPTGGRRVVSGDFDYVAIHRDFGVPFARVVDCCNGLVLLDTGADDAMGCCVANPATRRQAPLPPCPPSPEGTTVESPCYSDRHLVFDPTVSPHYQVLVLPHRFPDKAEVKARAGEGLVEWPPSPWTIQVFSSRTRRWEDRSIVRDGEGIAADLLQSSLQHPIMPYYYAAYWHGVLYLHFNDDFLVRVTLSDDKYQVIRTPASVDATTFGELRIGKSKSGVYCAITCRYQLRVWLLREFGGRTEWILTHEKNIGAILTHICLNIGFNVDGPWILQDDCKEDGKEKGELEWDFNADNVLDIDIQDVDGKYGDGAVPIIGFHPYKEVIFLNVWNFAVAYHWNSSKVQYLSRRLWTRVCHDESVESYFIYTPCWVGELSEEN